MKASLVFLIVGALVTTPAHAQTASEADLVEQLSKALESAPVGIRFQGHSVVERPGDNFAHKTSFDCEYFPGAIQMYRCKFSPLAAASRRQSGVTYHWVTTYVRGPLSALVYEANAIDLEPESRKPYPVAVLDEGKLFRAAVPYHHTPLDYFLPSARLLNGPLVADAWKQGSAGSPDASIQSEGEKLLVTFRRGGDPETYVIDPSRGYFLTGVERSLGVCDETIVETVKISEFFEKDGRFLPKLATYLRVTKGGTVQERVSLVVNEIELFDPATKPISIEIPKGHRVMDHRTNTSFVVGQSPKELLEGIKNEIAPGSSEPSQSRP